MAKKTKALDSKIAEIEKPLGKRFTTVIVPSLISTVEEQIIDPNLSVPIPLLYWKCPPRSFTLNIVLPKWTDKKNTPAFSNADQSIFLVVRPPAVSPFMWFE